MEILYLLINIINDVLIRGLFISILSILIAGRVLKTDVHNAFTIIKWIILVYAGLNICYYFFAYFAIPARTSFFERATGPYSFTFYLMLVPNTVLPLLLLKKWRYNKYLMLTLSFLMNIGWTFELLVIYVMTTHRDYITTRPSFNYLWLVVLKGFFIGALIYVIGRAFKRKMPAIHTNV